MHEREKGEEGRRKEEREGERGGERERGERGERGGEKGGKEGERERKRKGKEEGERARADGAAAKRGTAHAAVKKFFGGCAPRPRLTVEGEGCHRTRRDKCEGEIGKGEQGASDALTQRAAA